jgi:hypothetical protein
MFAPDFAAVGGADLTAGPATGDATGKAQSHSTDSRALKIIPEIETLLEKAIHVFSGLDTKNRQLVL